MAAALMMSGLAYGNLATLIVALVRIGWIPVTDAGRSPLLAASWLGPFLLLATLACLRFGRSRNVAEIEAEYQGADTARRRRWRKIADAYILLSITALPVAVFL